jgi:orotate phosphoribosyltransferase
MDKRAELRVKALKDLQSSEVLMLDGHFDYGNGYHGRAYLNAHLLFRHPSTIWQFAQDLLDLLPGDLLQRVEVVAGPVTGGALLAHTIAGLLDSRRSLTHPRCLFAPFTLRHDGEFTLRSFYRREIAGKRVLVVDDVRNTGDTLARCGGLVAAADGIVLATAEIYDRLESIHDLGAPNFALAEYKAPENVPKAACPLCAARVPITEF